MKQQSLIFRKAIELKYYFDMLAELKEPSYLQCLIASIDETVLERMKKYRWREVHFIIHEKGITVHLGTVRETTCVQQWSHVWKKEIAWGCTDFVFDFYKEEPEEIKDFVVEKLKRFLSLKNHFDVFE